jgi:hypothetical protein
MIRFIVFRLTTGHPVPLFVLPLFHFTAQGIELCAGVAALAGFYSAVL